MAIVLFCGAISSFAQLDGFVSLQYSLHCFEHLVHYSLSASKLDEHCNPRTDFVKACWWLVRTPCLHLVEESLLIRTVISLTFGNLEQQISMLLTSSKIYVDTLRRRQIRIIHSEHIIPLLLLHVSSLKVRLVKYKAIRTCSTLKSVPSGRIVLCSSSARYCQAVSAVRADCHLLSAVV